MYRICHKKGKNSLFGGEIKNTTQNGKSNILPGPFSLSLVQQEISCLGEELVFTHEAKLTIGRLRLDIPCSSEQKLLNIAKLKKK